MRHWRFHAARAAPRRDENLIVGRRVRTSDTDHARCLGHIDRGGDGEHPFVLVLIDIDNVAVRLQSTPPRLDGYGDERARGPRRDTKV